MEMTDQPEGDPQITTIADAVLKLKELRESNKNLNEPDVEEKFARLSLAFKTDKFTLSKRLDLQQRQRDFAEKNIECELKSLRESLNALNQLCSDSDMREVITKTQQHVDIVQQTTMRMSSRAETYGAIQQEQRMNSAFEAMLSYVEHVKLLYDKEHMELEEYKRLLAEHNLLPDDKGSSDGTEDVKRMLPPRSHSLSSSSKPVFQRRGSLGALIRPTLHETPKTITRENMPSFSSGTIRPPMEPRPRLLSAICLLNNNHYSNNSSDTFRSSNGSGASNSSLSPQNRRSSLPVGPMSAASSSGMTIRNIQVPDGHENGKTIKNDVERHETIAEVSQAAIDAAAAETKDDVNRNETSNQTSQLNEDDPMLNKDSSSELKSSSQYQYEENIHELSYSRQSSAETGSEISCNPECEIIVLPKAEVMSFRKLLQWSRDQGFWHWDSGTFTLRLRYLLSATLAMAAMFSLMLTFLPNSIIAFPL